MTEAIVNYCTIRDSIDDSDIEELHLECRMSDGQKGAFVIVDADFPELAEAIASFLNTKYQQVSPPSGDPDKS